MGPGERVSTARDLPRCLGDLAHGLEVALGGDRKARLADVDAQPAELVADVDFLLDVQRRAGRLLAVAQRRVEDPQLLGGGLGRLRGEGPERERPPQRSSGRAPSGDAAEEHGERGRVGGEETRGRSKILPPLGALVPLGDDALIDPALGARDNARDAMRATFLLGALLSTTTVSAQRPKLSSGTAAKGTSQDESLGSQLLSTVLSNDVQQAR